MIFFAIIISDEGNFGICKNIKKLTIKIHIETKKIPLK